jgi:hypothetical protein
MSSAHLIALAALFVALSGSAYAVGLKPNSVGTEELQPRAVEHQDLAPDAVTSGKVEDGTLALKDFAENQLPAGGEGAVGPRGEQGERGLQGLPGADGQDGSPDTPQHVLDKLKQVDGSGSGVDADTVDGQNLAGAFVSADDIFVMDRLSVTDSSPGDTSYESESLHTTDEGIEIIGDCARNHGGNTSDVAILKADPGPGGAVYSIYPNDPQGGQWIGIANSGVQRTEFAIVTGGGEIVTGVVVTGASDSQCTFAATFTG